MREGQFFLAISGNRGDQWIFEQQMQLEFSVKFPEDKSRDRKVNIGNDTLIVVDKFKGDKLMAYPRIDGLILVKPDLFWEDAEFQFTVRHASLRTNPGAWLLTYHGPESFETFAKEFWKRLQKEVEPE